MEGQGSAAVRRDARRRSARLPLAAAGLVLVERVLMDQVGSPVALLRALGDLGRSWADPVASVLALIALLAETVAAYGLVVLVLYSLSVLPGFVGRSSAGSCRWSLRRWSSTCSTCSLGVRCSP